jgi:hypothetical protein
MEQRDIAVFGRTGDEAVPVRGWICVDIAVLNADKCLLVEMEGESKGFPECSYS